MKASFTVALFSSVASLAAAQFTFNSTSGNYTCSSTSLAAYCLGGPEILRCYEGEGIVGNCNDNLVGEQPAGNNGLAGCYQSSLQSGDAACTKNGLVYPSSGSGADFDAAPFAVPVSSTTSTPPYPIVTATGPLATGYSNITVSYNGTASANSTGSYNSTGSALGDGGSGSGSRWPNTTIVATTTTATPAYTAGAGAGSTTTFTTSSVISPSATTSSNGTAQYTGAAPAMLPSFLLGSVALFIAAAI